TPTHRRHAPSAAKRKNVCLRLRRPPPRHRRQTRIPESHRRVRPDTRGPRRPLPRLPERLKALIVIMCGQPPSLTLCSPVSPVVKTLTLIPPLKLTSPATSSTSPPPPAPTSPYALPAFSRPQHPPTQSSALPESLHSSPQASRSPP